MEQLEGKVAVVTGAASGIGRALASRFAAEGMKLVLADVEAEPLERVAADLRAEGSEVLAECCDVRESKALDALAERCKEQFGVAHVLCNNAGVGGGGPLWETPPEDWDWVIGVNLVGVVNGIRAFVPGMIASGEPGHVVNTASVAGLTNPAFLGPYNATKHAVVAISETLRADLNAVQAGAIGVSVLCPGWVATQIADSDRNRPGGPGTTPADAALRDAVSGLVAGGMPADELASQVLEAIRENRFWIRTHPAMEKHIRARAQAVLDASPPPLMLPTEIE